MVVGVNVLQSEVEAPREILRIDPAAERDQVDRLRALRGRRNAEKAAATLATPHHRGAGGPQPHAVHPRLRPREVTLGEIADGLRGVYGEYREADLE